MNNKRDFTIIKNLIKRAILKRGEMIDVIKEGGKKHKYKVAWNQSFMQCSIGVKINSALLVLLDTICF